MAQVKVFMMDRKKKKLMTPAFVKVWGGGTKDITIYVKMRLQMDW